MRGPIYFLDYLLRADFGGSDYTFSNGDDVETNSSGSVQDGALTVSDPGGGTVKVLSNQLQIDNALSGWSSGVYSGSVSRSRGLALKSKVTTPSTYDRTGQFSWSSNQTLSVLYWGYQLGFSSAGQLYFRSDDNAGNDQHTIHLGSVSSSTQYSGAIVVGGYSSGVPWDGVSSGYSDGAAMFFYDGSNWLLKYKTDYGTWGTLYANYITSGRDWLYDDIKIPDADLSSLLQPLVLDTFTDSNGTALTSHTPDVDTVGGGWSTDTEGTDIHEIQSNMVRADGSTDRVYSTIDTGKSDVFVEALCDAPLSGGGGVGVVVLRYQDINNLWQFSGFDNDAILYERVSGSFTPRGGTGVIDSGTLLRVVCTCDDETIKCYVSDTEEVSYTSAANFKTETSHGVRSSSQGDVDNFAVYPIGNGGEYSAIGNY